MAWIKSHESGVWNSSADEIVRTDIWIGEGIKSTSGLESLGTLEGIRFGSMLPGSTQFRVSNVSVSPEQGAEKDNCRAVVTYTNNVGAPDDGGGEPDSSPRWRYSTNTITVHVNEDLNGNPIGATGEDTDVLLPNSVASVTLWKSQPIDFGDYRSVVGTVNDRPFIGASVGRMLYMGFEARETRERVWEINHSFWYKSPTQQYQWRFFTKEPVKVDFGAGTEKFIIKTYGGDTHTSAIYESGNFGLLGIPGT